MSNPTTAGIHWDAPNEGAPDFYLLTISAPGIVPFEVKLPGTQTQYLYTVHPPGPLHIQLQTMNSRGLKGRAISLDISIP